MDKLMMLYSDKKGTVYEHESAEAAFRTGRSFVVPERGELISLPYGSYLFSLPDRAPVSAAKGGSFKPVKRDMYGRKIWGVSAFLSSAYLRTFLPAYVPEAGGRPLPMWAYAGVAVSEDGEFLVPAVRIDEDVRSDPAIHENHEELDLAIDEVRGMYPENRLVRQLSTCSREYGCLCARNFFLSRYEAPVPTSPACNARCLGCLSHQNEGGPFPESQPRLNFKPAPEEIAGLILHHFRRVDRAVASFGQGCEGEPLMRGRDLAEAISMVRKETSSGTININTNGSIPEAVKMMIDAGLDSIRVSMNSPDPDYYNRYYSPVNYALSDVYRTIETALSAGIFTSLNLFFLPGFTDSAAEAEKLLAFLRRFPVNMIQTRNLNIDPDYYLDSIGFEDSEPLGTAVLLNMIRAEFPKIRLGYYNPPRETFQQG